MSVASPARELVVPLGRGPAVVKTEPCAPIGWLRGRLLSLLEIPRWQALVYRVFKLPPLVRVEPEGENRVLDLRNLHYNRARGVSLCSNPFDFVLGVEFETEQGEQTHKASTFCRPRHPLYREQNAEDARLYVDDLRARVCENLAEQLAALKSEIRRLEEVGKNA